MNPKILACLAIAATAAAAGGCAHTPLKPVQVGAAVLVNSTGAEVGRVALREHETGLLMEVTVAGLPTGLHGMHLHAVGKCEGPGFTTAGGHINPHQKQHGAENPAGAHMGDLPNLEVAADGTGRARIPLAADVLVHEAGLFDADGAALVIHASPDDYRTDPTGNSGARVACGAFTRG